MTVSTEDGTTQRMQDSPENRLEIRLRRAAEQFNYPPTPRLDSNSITRAAVLRRDRRRRAALRWAIAAVLMIAAGMLAAPPVRAAILDFIQVGVVRIFRRGAPQVPATVPPPPTASASISAPPGTETGVFDLVLLHRLSGETTLDVARQRVDFPVPLPNYPPQFGQPDHVFLQDMGGEAVILVWTDPLDRGRVRLALQLIAGDSWALKKIEPQVVQETTVDNLPAVWAEGPYFLIVGNGQTDLGRLVTGNSLIWERDGITYRLESDLSMEEALKVAESLE